METSIESTPVASTEEELQAILAGGEELDDNGNPVAKPAEPAKPASTEPPIIKTQTNIDGPGAGEEEEEEPGKKPEPSKPAVAAKKVVDPTKITDDITIETEGDIDELVATVKDYPSVIHWLNKTHELNLNLEGMDQMTPEQQAEALHGVVTRMTSGVNNALEDYQYIEELLQDDEVQSLLKAKHEGKSLKDLIGTSGTSAMSDDDLAINNFKSKFPKSDDNAIRSMVDSLKKNGQFEPFIKSLREQEVEEQSTQQQKATQEAEKLAEQQWATEQRELQEYVGYVENLTEVYGVPLTPEMKKNVLKLSTQRDDTGNTYLDYALQSNQGTVLATLGIAFMKKLIESSSSLEGNRKRNKLMDKIFDTPDKLQGGSAGNQKNEEDLYDPALLGKF